MSKVGVSALLERAFSWGGLLGRGGMGEVFEGLHRTSHTPIVLKCPHHHLSSLQDGSSASAGQRLFEQEAQLAARLRHPQLVPVYDYGVLDEPLCLGSTTLEAGRPFALMAKVQGLPLPSARAHPAWLHIICSLLDTIAYAHAQGVLHRDLKPSNILWDEQAQLPVIIDLGLAALAHDVRAQRGGTLAYAAPEQLSISPGQGFGQGPWTDLYAIGCIAFELMTGALPFVGASSQELIAQKLAGVLPDLGAMPAPLRAWFRLMLAREPEDRYSHASLAKQDLLLCEASLASTPAAPAPAPSPSPSLAPAPRSQLMSWGWSAQLLSAVLDDDPGYPRIADDLNVASAQPITIPDWRTLELEPSWPAVLPGLGQGVYQWRALPIFGREQTRDRLWSTLERFHASAASTSSSPLMTLVCGEAGCGKSRLVSWLSGAAEVIGVSYTLWITFDLNAKDSDEPLRLALLRHLGCEGLAGADAQARLKRRLAPLRALSSQAQFILSQWLIPGEHKVQPAAPERQRAWRELISALAAARPLIVVMDDWPWGRVCFEWMRGLLESPQGDSSRLWLLATARQEALEQDAQAQAQAQALERLGARIERLGALDARSHRQLISRLLTLEDAQAALLAERTAGNPLYAVQLAGAWLELGQLKPTPDGFEATVSLEQTLPQDLTALSLTRLHLALSPFGPRAWRALGAAALFAPSLNDRQWRALAAMAQIDAKALLAALNERGLVEPELYGWRFMHGILRETLLQEHRRMGGLTLAHDDCARLLDESLPEASSQRLSLVPYLSGAGLLIEAASVLNDISSSAAQDDLLDHARRLAPFVEALPTAKVQLLFAIWHTYRNYGHVELAANTLAQLESLTSSMQSSPVVRLNMLLARHDFHVSGRDDDELERGMRAALADEAIHDHPDLKCFALSQLGDLYQHQGRYEESLSFFEQALTHGPQKPWYRSWVYYSIANVLSSMERFDEAASYATRAREIFEALDLQMGIASCMVLEAERAQAQGELAQVYALNQRAYEIYVMVGDLGDLLTAENLARVALELGDLRDAERWARIVWDALKERAAKTFVHDILASLYAEQSRWSELEAVLARPCDPMMAVSDSPQLLALAIERATQASQHDLVRALTALSHQIQLAPGVRTDGS